MCITQCDVSVAFRMKYPSIPIHRPSIHRPSRFVQRISAAPAKPSAIGQQKLVIHDIVCHNVCGLLTYGLRWLETKYLHIIIYIALSRLLCIKSAIYMASCPRAHSVSYYYYNIYIHPSEGHHFLKIGVLPIMYNNNIYKRSTCMHACM